MVRVLDAGVGFSTQNSRKTGNSSPGIVAGADREPARGDAEILAAGPRAVEARALEDRHVLEALVRRGQDSEPREAEVAITDRRLQLAEIIVGQVVDQPSRHPVLDDVDRDRESVDETPVQGLEREADLFVGPDRRARPAADRGVLLEVQPGKLRRQRRVGRPVRGGGERHGRLQHGIGGERNGLGQRLGRGRTHSRPRSRRSHRSADRPFQEFATLRRHDGRFVRLPPVQPAAGNRTGRRSFPKHDEELSAQRGQCPSSRRAPPPAFSFLYAILRRRETHFVSGQIWNFA